MESQSEISTSTSIREIHVVMEQQRALIEELNTRDRERAQELISIQARVGAGAKFKIGAIEKFEGDKRKLRGFLTDVRVHHKLERILAEADKTMYAITHLGGTPKTYFEPFTKEFLEKESDDWGEATRRIFTNYSTFETLLESAFGNVDMAKEQAQKIVELKQTKSAAKFATEFLHLKSYLDWEETAYIQVFEQALKPEVRRGLLYAPKPRTLLSLIDSAVRIDNAEYEIRKRRTPDVGERPRAKKDKEGDTIMTGAVDQQEARKKGLCFFCGRKGHMARDCYSKKKSFDGNDKGKGKAKYERAEASSAALRMSIGAMDIQNADSHHGEYEGIREGDDPLDTEEGDDPLNYESDSSDTAVNEDEELIERLQATGGQMRELREAVEEQTRRLQELATLVIARNQETIQTLEGTEQEIDEFEGAQEIEELAAALANIEIAQETAERQFEGQSERNPLAPLTSPECIELPPPYTEREPSLGEGLEGDRMAQVLRDRAQRPGESSHVEYQRLSERLRTRRREMIEIRNNTPKECCCAVWKQQCYIKTREKMTIHAATCQTCRDWLDKCPQHSRQEKLRNFDRMESYKYAPWLEYPHVNYQYKDEWRCDWNNDCSWYTCHNGECDVHRQLKEKNRTFPEPPLVLCENARKCPCLRIGCACQEENEQHELHELIRGNQCRTRNWCPFHGEVRIAAFEDGQKPMNVPRIFLQVNLAGMDRCAMVDTGACRSLIGAHMVEEIDEFPETEMTCIDYAGNQTQEKVKLIRGYYQMEGKSFQDWFVIQKFKSAALGYDILLGIDWCRKYDVTIRCSKGEVTLSRTGPRGRIERMSVASVHLKQPDSVEIHYSEKDQPEDKEIKTVQGKQVRFEETNKASRRKHSRRNSGKEMSTFSLEMKSPDQK